MIHKSRKRQTFKIILLLVSFLLILGGCSSKQETASESENEVEENLTSNEDEESTEKEDKTLEEEVEVEESKDNEGDVKMNTTDKNSLEDNNLTEENVLEKLEVEVVKNNIHEQAAKETKDEKVTKEVANIIGSEVKIIDLLGIAVVTVDVKELGDEDVMTSFVTELGNDVQKDYPDHVVMVYVTKDGAQLVEIII
jgi:flagellum-specific peptidoglycan hydrolase FlgJ